MLGIEDALEMGIGAEDKVETSRRGRGYHLLQEEHKGVSEIRRKQHKEGLDTNISEGALL